MVQTFQFIWEAEHVPLKHYTIYNNRDFWENCVILNIQQRNCINNIILIIQTIYLCIHYRQMFDLFMLIGDYYAAFDICEWNNAKNTLVFQDIIWLLHIMNCSCYWITVICWCKVTAACQWSFIFNLSHMWPLPCHLTLTVVITMPINNCTGTVS